MTLPLIIAAANPSASDTILIALLRGGQHRTYHFVDFFIFVFLLEAFASPGNLDTLLHYHLHEERLSTCVLRRGLKSNLTIRRSVESHCHILG